MNKEIASNNFGNEPLFTTLQLAEKFETTPQFWEGMRTRGDGPAFIKVGRLVRYRQSAIDQWMDDRTVRSTTRGRHL